MLTLKLVDARPEVLLQPLPSLPVALAESSGLAMDDKIYLFSGRSIGGTVRKAFRLDFGRSPLKWEELPWPQGARGRMHSVAGSHEGKLFLSGVGIINRIRNSNIPRTAWRRKNLIFFVTVTALIRMRASGLGLPIFRKVPRPLPTGQSHPGVPTC